MQTSCKTGWVECAVHAAFETMRHHCVECPWNKQVISCRLCTLSWVAAVQGYIQTVCVTNNITVHTWTCWFGSIGTEDVQAALWNSHFLTDSWQYLQVPVRLPFVWTCVCVCVANMCWHVLGFEYNAYYASHQVGSEIQDRLCILLASKR